MIFHSTFRIPFGRHADDRIGCANCVCDSQTFYMTGLNLQAAPFFKPFHPAPLHTAKLPSKDAYIGPV
jgi:hypothetical protein